ncbi:MAG: MgtC/SapB family protein [Actinomycetota bacterium]
MTEITIWDLFLRLAVAGLLGGLIGFEREMSGQAAGIRTHLLVSLGSALFTVVGAYGLADFESSNNIRFDPTRVAAQVVTGIGFLGAGAIIQSGITIRGLTTAAGMWVAAAVGMATAYGYWPAALGSTVFAVLALYGLKIVDRRFIRYLGGSHAYVALTTTDEFDIADLERTVQEHGARLVSFKVRAEDAQNRHLSANVRLEEDTKPVDLARAIAEIPGVVDVDSIS